MLSICQILLEGLYTNYSIIFLEQMYDTRYYYQTILLMKKGGTVRSHNLVKVP